VKCRSLTSDSSSRRPVGSPCESDDDCLYGQCTNKICTAPVLLCPTNIPGECVSASLLLSVLPSLSLFLRLSSSSSYCVSLPLLPPFWCAYRFLTLHSPPYLFIPIPIPHLFLTLSTTFLPPFLPPSLTLSFYTPIQEQYVPRMEHANTLILRVTFCLFVLSSMCAVPCLALVITDSEGRTALSTAPCSMPETV
jgi:hypothetical protein